MKKRLLTVALAAIAICSLFTACDGIKWKTDHEHDKCLTKVEAKESSCTQAGNTEYFVCTCGKWFADDLAQTEIIDKTTVEIAQKAHAYSCQNTAAEYLKSAATCTEKAVYYYSCECGEKGSQTFEYGEIDENAHAYGEWVSNGNGTHTKTCANDNTHVVTENCKGGTATGSSQANCSGCGENYDTNAGDNVLYVSNAEEFIAFANEVNSGVNYDKKTVYLVNDIDLTGLTFNGIGGKHATSHIFDGVFDGQNHTVTGVNIYNKCPEKDADGNWINGCYAACESAWDACAGFFNNLGGDAVVKNLIIKGANICSDHYAGGIAAYCYNTAKIENCKVIDSKITSKTVTVGDTSDCGDKAGGIVGYLFHSAVVNNCTVENTTITAYRDLGAIVGYANDGTTVTNCAIGSDVVVKVDRSVNYKNYTEAREYDAGNFVGQADEVIDVVTGNTGSATILNADYYISTADELFEVAANVNGNTNYYLNKTILLLNDVDLENREWTPIGKTTNTEFRGTFDGNGKTIKNLKITEAADADAYAGIGLFGWVGSNGAGMAYVKNLTVDGANVSGSSYVGTLVGYLQFGAVENCTVKNAIVTSTHKNGDRCGDKAGALIGVVAPNGINAAVQNCKATDCKVVAARDAAKLIGMGYSGCTFANLFAENVTVTAEVGECAHKRKGVLSVNSLIGNTTADGLSEEYITFD